MKTLHDDLKYWISFIKIPGIGRVKIDLLLQHFDNLENAWNAGNNELYNIGFDEKLSASISNYKKKY